MGVLQGLRYASCTRAVGQHTIPNLLGSRIATKRPMAARRSFVTSPRCYSQTSAPEERLSETQQPAESSASTSGTNKSSIDQWSFMKDISKPIPSPYSAQHDLYSKANRSPDDAWRSRSNDIATHMRDTLITTAGLPLVDYIRKKSIVGYDITISGLQVPTVSTGRTVTAPTFQLAISRLNQVLQRNRVKQEWRRDMRHEKGAVKRYRLRSERHRRRFAAMVRRKVQIVQAIRQRGM